MSLGLQLQARPGAQKGPDFNRFSPAAPACGGGGGAFQFGGATWPNEVSSGGLRPPVCLRRQFASPQGDVRRNASSPDFNRWVRAGAWAQAGAPILKHTHYEEPGFTKKRVTMLCFLMENFAFLLFRQWNWDFLRCVFTT